MKWLTIVSTLFKVKAYCGFLKRRIMGPAMVLVSIAAIIVHSLPKLLTHVGNCSHSVSERTAMCSESNMAHTLSSFITDALCLWLFLRLWRMCIRWCKLSGEMTSVCSVMLPLLGFAMAVISGHVCVMFTGWTIRARKVTCGSLGCRSATQCTNNCMQSKLEPLYTLAEIAAHCAKHT